jgi:hypothetical protein
MAALYIYICVCVCVCYLYLQNIIFVYPWRWNKTISCYINIILEVNFFFFVILFVSAVPLWFVPNEGFVVTKNLFLPMIKYTALII